MILEQETFDVYGYYPRDLKSHSNKHILAACANCGKIRITSRYAYRALCKSCARKGEYLSDKTKCLMSEAHIGNKNHNYIDGLSVTNVKKYRKLYREKNKKKLLKQESLHHKSLKGRISDRRSQAKRHRELGYTLLMPLEEGEVGHHVTDEYVIAIPESVHQKFSGHNREIHRALVFEWLKDNDSEKYKLALEVLK